MPAGLTPWFEWNPMISFGKGLTNSSFEEVSLATYEARRRPSVAPTRELSAATREE